MKQEKILYKITELVELGFPRRAVEMAVHSKYSSEFARRTSPHGHWYINLKNFQRCWDEGKILRQ